MPINYSWSLVIGKLPRYVPVTRDKFTPLVTVKSTRALRALVLFTVTRGVNLNYPLVVNYITRGFATRDVN